MGNSEQGNILLITTTLAGGGSEKVLLNVADGFLMRGYHVTIALLKDEVAYDVDWRVKLVKFNGSKIVNSQKALKNLLLRRFFAQISLDHGPFDLILSNYQSRTRFLPKSLIDKVYYWVHSDYWTAIEYLRNTHQQGKAKRQEKRIQDYFNGKKLVAVSEGVKQSLLSNNAVQAECVEVIYNPFDFDRIQAMAEMRCSALPREPFILHAARFDINKRHDLLLQAFKTIQPPVKLVLLTKKNNELEDLIQKNSLCDRVMVTGFQKNPYPWFMNAKLYVLSSDSGEALPTVLIESLACGTPVVSTDCPYGPREIMTGDLAKWLVPNKDVNALSLAIDKALQSDIEIDKSGLEKFTYDRVMRQYIELSQ